MAVHSVVLTLMRTVCWVVGEHYKSSMSNSIMGNVTDLVAAQLRVVSSALSQHRGPAESLSTAVQQYNAVYSQRDGFELERSSRTWHKKIRLAA